MASPGGEEVERAAKVPGRGLAAGREVLAVALGVVAYVVLVWMTRGELGMVWDEPPDIERQEAIAEWLGALIGPPADPAAAFGRERLERGWRFTRQAPDEHPPLYALLSLATGTAAGGLVGPLRAHRLSTVLVLAVSAGALVRLVRTRWGTLPALAALGALLFNPRLFADAQLVTLDAVVGGFWFLAAVAFLRGCESGRAPWRFGVLAGLTVMSKATGALVFPALLLWTLVYRPKGAWRQFAWAVPIVPPVMLAINPGWWPGPVGSVTRWAAARLHYQQKIPVYYLGRVYDAKTTFLPWHNPAVLCATMVPPGLLALAAVGLGAAGWRTFARDAPDPEAAPTPAFLPDRAVGGWAAIQFLTLMVLRMFPFMPGHDGLRQLIPAFFFFPVLAGFGARALIQASARSRSRTRSRAVRALVLACVASAGWETLRIHPYELEYYNVLIGGPRGAKAAGMETTYYWDVVNDEVLRWMNENLESGATVLISPPPDVRTFARLQRYGKLRRDLEFLNLDPPRAGEAIARIWGNRPCYMIFLMRQGLYLQARPENRRVIEQLAKAPARFELAPARAGGVRLLAIFDQQQLRAAFETRRTAPP